MCCEKYIITNLQKWFENEMLVKIKAILVDENGGGIPVILSKSNTGVWVAYTEGGILLPLLSPETGKPITDIYEGQVVMICDVVKADKKVQR